MATLILKATERCNANCYYCDVVRKESSGTSMGLDVLESVFVRANEYLRDNPHERLTLIWHGGEPLLLGPRYYKAAFDLQERHCPETRDRITHAIQSNLTCFRESFIDPLRKLGITSIGTSYDPEPGIRGPGKEINTAVYNAKFQKAVRILDRHGIGWGVIYVVTRRSLEDPLGVFHFLTNLKPSGGVNLNPVLIYDEDRQDVAITPEEYTDFLGAIFETWWNHRSRYPHVEPFHSLVDTIIDGQRNLGCVDSGSCTYEHVNIAPDGETSQCGRSADWGLLPYGNIAALPLADILRSKNRDVLETRQAVLREGECSDCRFWELCHGGCPLDAWSKHESFLHKTEWCESKRGFVEKYFEPVTGTRFAGVAPCSGTGCQTG